MTEKEQDEYLMTVLRRYVEVLKETNSAEKQNNFPDSKTAVSENEEMISDLEEIAAKINSIEELAELGPDAIDTVFEAVSAYAGDFVVSADEKQRKKDLEECAKLEEIIWLFCDEDDEAEEDEESDD